MGGSPLHILAHHCVAFVSANQPEPMMGFCILLPLIQTKVCIAYYAIEQSQWVDGSWHQCPSPCPVIDPHREKGEEERTVNNVCIKQAPV